MTEDSDFILVKKFLTGDEKAFNIIVHKYQKKIYWHARRMLGNHMDADEVTQDVLIVIYKRLNTFKFNSSLFTWIFRITSTRCLNAIKKRNLKRIFSLDNESHKNIRDSCDIVKSIEDKEKLDLLSLQLDKLPVKQREVFILRRFDELSYDEISKITGKTIGALKANYHLALKKILTNYNEK
ncbi:ECF RNA polymerase sigma-E factor [bacterium BMS3Abin04]|nr:ECF RNA polymerase sigma-E factor [bacterium BMS3Abin04]